MQMLSTTTTKPARRFGVLSAVAALALGTLGAPSAAAAPSRPPTATSRGAADGSTPPRAPSGTIARGLVNPGAWVVSSGLYLSSATSKAVTANTRLERVIAVTGEVVASHNVGGQPVAVTEANNKLWVQTDTLLKGGVASGPVLVSVLNPTTLQVERTVRLGRSNLGVGLVAAGGVVWAGDATDLVRIDPATDLVTKTIAASTDDGKNAMYTGVTTDSRGRSLVTSVLNRTATRIQRRNSQSGTVEARSAAFKSFGSTAESVYDNGAWTEVDAGTSRYLERFSLTTLQVTATPAAAAGSTWARVYGGHLFVQGQTTPRYAYCGNLITGQPEANLATVQDGQILAASTTTYYYEPNATSTNVTHRVQRASVPAAC